MNPICFAIDTPHKANIQQLVTETRDEVGMFKLGLTTVYGVGIEIIQEIDWGLPLFLDAKLHDIPKQVGGAVDAIRGLGASLVTVHAAGGTEMIRAAVDASAGELSIIAVTVLTSLDDAIVERVGFRGTVSDSVARLVDVAMEGGAQGIVCSPHEVAVVRARVGDDPLIVAPGIRETATDDDQRRTMGARAALDAGADVLVIGRPISEAPDVAAAARRIRKQLAA